MNSKQNTWLFITKNFLWVEFIFLILLSVSNLIIRFKLFSSSCKVGIPCFPPSCQTIIPQTECSSVVGRFGVAIFSNLFLVYLLGFIIYRIFKKDIKGAILPIIILIVVFVLERIWIG